MNKIKLNIYLQVIMQIIYYDKVFWNFTDNPEVFSLKNNKENENNQFYKFNNYFFILGYDTLFGTIYNFLYSDIKDI